MDNEPEYGDEHDENEDLPGTPDDPAGEDAPDEVKVIATLMDGETVEFMVPRGSTLLDLSRRLHLPDPTKKVAVDEDDRILTPEHVFEADVTYITYVMQGKGG